MATTGIPPYPAKPAEPSPIDPTKALAKNLLRVVLGDVRKGGPSVILEEGQENEIVKLKLKGRNGHEYSVELTGDEKRADCWFDFVADRIEDLQLSLEATVGDVSARAVVLGSEWVDLKGVVKRALVDLEGNVIGVIVLDYLVIKPFEWTRLGEAAALFEAITKQSANENGELGAKKENGNNEEHEMDGKEKVTIFAGHRGVGSNKSLTFVQENTLLSFVMATRGPLVKHVELDVQLTKDGHPVVYHDYFVNKDENGKGGRPIYSLTLQEWKDLVKKPASPEDAGYYSDHGGNKNHRRKPGKKSRSAKKSGNNDVGERAVREKISQANVEAWTMPYGIDNLRGKLRDELPTLKRVCRKVPKNVGLLLEIKYPPPETAEEETLPYPEKNLIVDETLYRILKEEQTGGRSVMFLTFDPDVAVMLKLKQKVHPVYYLNSESREEDTDLLDPRCTSIDGAFQFSLSQHFDGMVLLADILFDDESLVQKIRDANMKLMTYGRINTVPERSCRQIELGVDGIIADNVTLIAKECSKCLPVHAKPSYSSGGSDSGHSGSVYSLVTTSDGDDADDH